MLRASVKTLRIIEHRLRSSAINTHCSHTRFQSSSNIFPSATRTHQQNMTLYTKIVSSMGSKTSMVAKDNAIKGRVEKMLIEGKHTIFGTQTDGTFEGMEEFQAGMGCFWGAEQRYWEQPGVVHTAVGYSGGYTENPTYEETCTAQTGHTECVRVVYDPKKTNLQALLKVFWESHDPTQQNRQGNDVGTQYRSALYLETDEQYQIAKKSRDAYQAALTKEGKGHISTDLREGPAPVFYYAEDYHQQYLDKNKGGYCGLKGTGVQCARGE
ncbi:peptide-methionine (S)-S-oxide reductase [Sphaeroforma arctica JP610]|uniref:Mitochondrial peptide methionine sulfoxide reductase n=1 Tax=Sphaeroforma arctica JP610 TaxID=667725 RepID=A0A0L0G8T6_9EUKA|nr:peptide-methionine (S)-S-oxide reductase [Sphaeroforma arctica JP610]KNC84643.1 peptide-methionine (S)-S-oxide reductase [Sphaeroforma arctica JP610]|eukprot:XP_014158545.1 peptide-methionine (S)-S-oxide reductase [Sphaeroforma arctica JP610]